MGGKSGFASRIAALILMGSNLLFMTLCAGTFALGLWVITSPSTLSRTIQTFGDGTMKALLPKESLEVQIGIVMAVLSMFLFSIAVMGFYGAIDRSQFLLFMYSVLVILLLLLECALLFYYTSNISEDCRETVSLWLKMYQMAIYIPLAVFHIVLSSCSLIRRGSPSRSHS